MGEAERALLEERYTYGNYRMWDDDLRWELIDGEAFCMSPGPGTVQQRVSVLPVKSLPEKLKLNTIPQEKKCSA